MSKKSDNFVNIYVIVKLINTFSTTVISNEIHIRYHITESRGNR